MKKIIIEDWFNDPHGWAGKYGHTIICIVNKKLFYRLMNLVGSNYWNSDRNIGSRFYCVKVHSLYDEFGPSVVKEIKAVQYVETERSTPISCGWLIDRSARCVALLTATLLGLGGVVVAMSRLRGDWIAGQAGPFRFPFAADLFPGGDARCARPGPERSCRWSASPPMGRAAGRRPGPGGRRLFRPCRRRIQQAAAAGQQRPWRWLRRRLADPLGRHRRGAVGLRVVRLADRPADRDRPARKSCGTRLAPEAEVSPSARRCGRRPSGPSHCRARFTCSSPRESRCSISRSSRSAASTAASFSPSR